MSGVRWGQTLLFTAVTIMTIINCCSAPLASNINYLAETKSSEQATSPLSRLNKLQMGMTGFCNKDKCISYREYTSNTKAVGQKLQLTTAQAKAVKILSGSGPEITGKTWMQLSILNGFAIAAGVFGTVTCAMLAKNDRLADFDPSGQEQGLVNGIRYLFLGTVFSNFALLLSAFAMSHIAFTNAKESLVASRSAGSYGISWYLSLIAFVISIGIACLEGLYVAITAKNRGKQGGRYDDRYDDQYGY